MPYVPPDPSAPIGAATELQASRDRAIALLTDRYGDGSLSEGGFESRLAWLSAAEHRGQIEELIAELRTAGASPEPVSFVPGLLPRGEERLLAIMSSTARQGIWTMPHRLATRVVMSELCIDLRDAILPPMSEIDLFALMANVQIIVPPELLVQCSLSPLMSTLRDDSTTPRWSALGAPRLLLSGSCIMSDVRIRVKLPGR